MFASARHTLFTYLFVCLLAVLLTLGVAANARAQSLPERVSIASDAGDAIKGAQRVAITQFGVEFYTRVIAIGRGGGATARQLSEMRGVSDAARQALVEKVYAATVARLKQAGFEVVEREVVQADPQYQALMKSYGKASPYTVHDSSLASFGDEMTSQLYAPVGMPAFYATGSNRGDMSDRLDAQNQGIAPKEAALAKSLNATLLKFHFLGTYALPNATKNGLLGNITNVARAGLDVGPTLLAQDTQVQIVNSSGGRTFTNSPRIGQSGAFYLKEMLRGPNVFEVAETTPDATKNSETAANFLNSFVLGNKVSQRTKTLEMTTDDATYSAAFAPLLDSANQALIDALVAAR